MYRKIVASASMLLLVVLALAAFLISARPDYTFAADLRLTADGEGSRLEPPGPLFGLENMAPGTEAVSSLTVINREDFDIDLSVSTKKRPGSTEALYDALRLTVTGVAIPYEGTLSEMQNVDLGTVPAGGEQEIAFTITFPPESGNECQGATLTVDWIFTAEAEDQGGESPGPSPGPGPGPGPGPEGPGRPGVPPGELPPDEVLIAPPEEAPATPPVPEPLEVPEEEAVATPPELPRTGEIPPLVFYAGGLLLAAAGALVGRKYWGKR